MPGMFERIEDKIKGHHDKGAEPVRDVPRDDSRIHGGDEMVDGAPRTQDSDPDVAPPDVADENEVNVGGAPRTHAHGQGHAPAMKADEDESMVAGAPRHVDDTRPAGTVDGAPRLGDQGQAGEDFRVHPQA